jgi:DNA polymerase-3 subunit epsilon
VALARKCWPELARHSLDALAREFGIEFRHHNAEEDAMVAARVVLRVAEEYSAESIEQLMERMQIRLGEVSTGAYRSCRRIPQKRKRAKLTYEPIAP